MRPGTLILLSLATVLPAAASAQATLNKCIDTQGKVTYSNLPCRNAKEARTVEIDPAPPAAPRKPPSSPPAVQPPPRPAPAAAPGEVHLEVRQTSGKPAPRVSARQCDALSEKLGNVLDKMDQARRKGYTPEQMNAWNEEARELERKKQQSGCF